MRIMQITLEDEKPLTWNQLYAGKHWGTRKAEADRVHEIVQAAVRERYAEPPKFEKVHIEVAYLSPERRTVRDPCNIPAKMYIDGLVHAGVIEDDSYKYVKSVTTKRIISDEPRKVVIEIVEA